MGLNEGRKITRKEDNEDLPDFDSDLSPNNIMNRTAAEARGLRYDEVERVYRDEDGCMIRDRYGQPL